MKKFRPRSMRIFRVARMEVYQKEACNDHRNGKVPPEPRMKMKQRDFRVGNDDWFLAEDRTKSSLRARNFDCRSMWLPIKCEQGTKETGGLDVWLGRLAMVGFASAITVEVVTGKGLLESFFNFPS
ncbi:hypothetical protein KSP40_PGU013016 [Platanthera guangdongensis]|uniref:High light inducible protein n=1 Tax=Platanthera guangdongensis TaxID=2320717 RepID=A0ABR2MMC2_9ASPA